MTAIWLIAVMLKNEESSITLHCPIIDPHSKSLEPTLIFNCHQISSIELVLIFWEVDVGDSLILCYFCPWTNTKGVHVGWKCL